MENLLTAFKDYVSSYAKDYLSLTEEELSSIPPEAFLSKVEEGYKENARFSYLRLFSWVLSEEYFIYYNASDKYRICLRISAKIFSLIEGDSIRFNDYETLDFVKQTKKPLSAFQHNIRLEPFDPSYEDYLHFISNFIDGYKRKHGIPLRMW